MNLPCVKHYKELITLVKSSLFMLRTHHHHHHHNDGGINQHSGDTTEVGVAVAADEGHHQGDTNASSSSLAANDRFLQETGFASPGLTLKSDSWFRVRVLLAFDVTNQVTNSKMLEQL